MKISKITLLIVMISFFAFSCSKRITATETNNTSADKDNPSVENNNAKPDTGNYFIKRKVIKTTVPKVITVNDIAAKKTIDGRLYYDLNGKRYWRNKKDGKYYLYNKTMYNNPDFKP